MKNFLKEIIRKNYFLWLLFSLHRRASGTFFAMYTGILRNNKSRKNIFNLRRDVHRIEKGLSFPNRRRIFAQDYIRVAVDRFSQCLKNETIDVATKDWATAVFNKYFTVVQHVGDIKIAYEIFSQLQEDNKKPHYIPYKSLERPPTDISYQRLLQLAQRRRSVRFFLDKEVDKELVGQAMEVALQAPSACNRQSYRFIFYNDAGQAQEIAKIPGGVRGYEVPSIVVVVAKYEGYFDERDMLVPFIDASLAVMSFEFALETLGLSSVSINWSQNPKINREIRNKVPLQEDECVVMMVGIGYADPEGKIAYSKKRAVNDVLTVISN